MIDVTFHDSMPPYAGTYLPLLYDEFGETLVVSKVLPFFIGVFPNVKGVLMAELEND